MNANTYLVASALLTWLMLMSASLLRSRGWTPDGMVLAFGNRDNMPEASPIAGRADRAAKNMLENLLLFVAVFVAAKSANVSNDAMTTGSAVFFWARVIYFAVYLAGIPYLRTAIWLVGVVGIGMLGMAALRT